MNRSSFFLALARVFLFFTVKVDSGALRGLPKKGPAIIVVNHINFLEAPLLPVLLKPRPVSALVKKETLEQGFIGTLARAWNAIPVDRDNPSRSSFEAVGAALQEGRLVIIAPEGTRSGHGRLQEGRTGAAYLAARWGVPIIPVAHFGGELVWDNLRRLRRTRVEIRIGSPFRMKDISLRRDFRHEAARQLMGQLSRLLPESHRGNYSVLPGEDLLDFIPAGEFHRVLPGMASEHDGSLRGRRCHIYDVDHTIISTSTGIANLWEMVKAGLVHPGPLLAYPFYMLRYRRGRGGGFDLLNDIPLLKGVSRAALVAASRLSFEKHLKRRIYPEMKDRIHQALERGERVILASSALQVHLEPLAQYLGVSELVCSRLSYNEEGLCTGRFEGSPAFGGNKKKLTLERLANLGIDPLECSFYSDSHHDLPLLEAVGSPVVVHPDQRLRREAKARGWSIHIPLL